eukprot:TRINITY_DN2090_c0_g2_i1.p1 TRINITY_DN2090_c0_g2~~TRINITY_DN2090_c0_g2_i1.p1  ORF type:complete len:1269 (+),score=434.36 TRINITY_DN2090_c0_g2_i1:244-4050(+)
MDDVDQELDELRKQRTVKKDGQLVGFSSTDGFDQDIYGGSSQYVSSIGAGDDDEDEDEVDTEKRRKNIPSYTGAAELIPEHEDESEYDPMAEHRASRVSDRETEYHQRRRNITLSPSRKDAFASGGATPGGDSRSYKEVMMERKLEKEEKLVREQIKKKMESGEPIEAAPSSSSKAVVAVPEKDNDGFAKPGLAKPKQRKRSRWDSGPAAPAAPSSAMPPPEIKRQKVESSWDNAAAAAAADANNAIKKASRWDATPVAHDAGDEGGWDGAAVTPMAVAKRSRWDATPVQSSGSETPRIGPGMATPAGSSAQFMQTPAVPMTPEHVMQMRWEKEIDVRNRPLSDDDLDGMFPSAGYKILVPPASYKPIMTPARRLQATPTPMAGSSGFMMHDESEAQMRSEDFGVKEMPGNLPSLKPEDEVFFSKIMTEDDETLLTQEEVTERKIMRLLLKIKNGTPPQRKVALRQITDKARDFGPGPLFNQILPLLMYSTTLEDQERHLLVKTIDRILYKLDDLVRPFCHKILVVIEPLLIDEDYYARVEGREIISNLAKAAGLATMISTMRPDIDHADEYVRNTTARAFAVVASALGIHSLLLFLKAVTRSKMSWQARHTGIKIVQQIAILMGCAVLPHLKGLVEIVAHGLTDEQPKVKTITALALAALAEAAAPYGIESFDCVLKPLWYGVRQHSGKILAAFLKAIGFIIPLMDAEYASYYTKEVTSCALIKQFGSSDPEMIKIVLKVVNQVISTEGVEPQYIRDEIMPKFFEHFWVRRMALERRNYKQLVETTVELANQVGVSEIVTQLVDDLKDESEQYRKMVVETIDKIVQKLGITDVDERLEMRLVDGILYAFTEQTDDDSPVILNGFGSVVNALGIRAKPYLSQICGLISWRLTNKSAKVRQYAADLIGRIAAVMKRCDEEKRMGGLGVVLYEHLGEEYPEVLGSILGALKAIVNVIGMDKMTPPIKDLLPRLTPVLKNRHAKVQENCIDLVGRIADVGHEHVSAREWERISYELLEMLKAPRKGIRRAAVNTFGYIAKAIGPPDVLGTLLTNLKVQERQNRVCTTVAIAIVAETCAPWTVLPAVMNEYRVPELNVQNGVLKSLSFMFEYIGETGKDYIYAVTSLLEDALMDRDAVHRQTACSVVKHMALGVYGSGCEDALIHLLNFVWPNIFETSPHVINAVMDAIQGLRVALGPARMMQYVLQGLFHPARKVREKYWKVYNDLYVGSQDALVALYPRLPELEGNELYGEAPVESKSCNFRRTELELFL